jgi:hypothetical protein
MDLLISCTSSVHAAFGGQAFLFKHQRPSKELAEIFQLRPDGYQLTRAQ